MEPFTGVFRDENDLSEGFVAAKRVDSRKHDNDSLLAIIKEHCIDKNQPIVISNMNESAGWDDQVFTLNSLKEYCGDWELAPSHSNNVKRTELLGNYIQTLQKLHNLNSSDQYATGDKKRRVLRGSNVTNDNLDQAEDLEIKKEYSCEVEMDTPTALQTSKSTKTPTPPTPPKVYKSVDYPIDKIYAKDITCPTEYKDAMSQFIPEYLHPHGNNDLFSLLPPRFKAENLMCYLAQNKTGTPMHRDICGTVGHNLMTMASPGGYAEWFIVVDEDREKLASVMKPVKQVDKEHIESANPNKLTTMSSFMESERGWLRKSHMKMNELTVQVILQQPGDLVIIPSRAYHQVRNIGITVKIAWNRVTAQTLANAFEDQLPLYQIVCRPEVFKCKAIVYYTLHEWNSQFEKLIDSDSKSMDDFTIMRYGRDSFVADSNMLLDLYLYNILYPEILSSTDEKSVIVDIPDEFCTVKCDFCHADVFYHYYECKTCDNYDLCMKCYISGRSCLHAKDMKMRRSDTDPSSLTDLYKDFIRNANQICGEAVFQDKSQFLDSSSLQEYPNLATMCRRLERYRKKANQKMNIFTCTHCLQDWTIAELSESGISFTSFLQRSVCEQASKSRTVKDLNVFVCQNCTDNCESCQPLIPTNDSMENISLVYYAPPSVDKRNLGACFDVGVKKSCEYPTVKKSKARNPKRTPGKKGMGKKVTVDDEEQSDGECDEKSTDAGEPMTLENNESTDNRRRSSRKRVKKPVATETSQKRVKSNSAPKKPEATKTVQKRARKRNVPKNPEDTETVETRIRKVNAPSNPEVTEDSEHQLRLMVNACRLEGAINPQTNYGSSTKHRFILPMGPALPLMSDPEIVSLLPGIAQRQNADDSPILIEDDVERDPLNPSGPLPFPKSALELYLEQMKKRSEKSVSERIIEAAQRVLKQPAKKAYAPPSDKYIEGESSTN